MVGSRCPRQRICWGRARRSVCKIRIATSWSCTVAPPCRLSLSWEFCSSSNWNYVLESVVDPSKDSLPTTMLQVGRREASVTPIGPVHAKRQLVLYWGLDRTHVPSFPPVSLLLSLMDCTTWYLKLMSSWETKWTSMFASFLKPKNAPATIYKLLRYQLLARSTRTLTSTNYTM